MMVRRLFGVLQTVLKQKDFFQVPRTQLEQKQGLGNRKVWRSEVLTTRA